MEAALVLALRGHEVLLLEKENVLGGQLRLAAIVPDGREMKNVVSYFETQLERLGVRIMLGMEATLEIILIFTVLIGSFLVSYIRARAEGLGLACQVGLFTRAERVVVLAIGLLAGQVLIALWILLVFAYVTVIQRLVHLRKET